MNPTKRLRRIRIWLVLFVIALALAGITAFPLATELRWLTQVLHDTSLPVPEALVTWIDKVQVGVEVADRDYPFLAYGTDWLAYAHLVIAVAFLGPYRDPVRNIWVIEWAMIACVAIIPLALIAGPIRDIPFWWQLIDMSFGVFGIIPLLIVRRHIRILEREQHAAQPTAEPVASSEPAPSS